MKIAKLRTFNLTRGNTYKEIKEFNRINEDGNKEPFDLSQFTDIKMDIRSGVTSRDPLIYSVSLNNGITISGTPANTITIIIPHTETIKWKASFYHRDIKFINVNGEEYTFCEGKIEVRQNVTE